MAEVVINSKDTLTVDSNLIRIGGIPVWNLTGISGRDPKTGVQLDGLNDRVLAAATSGTGGAMSAAEYMCQLAKDIDSLGSETERRLRDEWLPEMNANP